MTCSNYCLWWRLCHVSLYMCTTCTELYSQDLTALVADFGLARMFQPVERKESSNKSNSRARGARRRFVCVCVQLFKWVPSPPHPPPYNTSPPAQDDSGRHSLLDGSRDAERRDLRWESGHLLIWHSSLWGEHLSAIHVYTCTLTSEHALRADIWT